MTTKLIIGGQEYDTQADPLVVLNPWDQTTEVGRCAQFTADQLELLQTKAQHGFETFRHSSLVTRMTILSTLANRMQKERETLARLITLESGKPIKLSRTEVDRAIMTCKGYADSLNRYEERWIYVQDRKACIKRFAYGPVLAITPFNFPLNLIIHKLAPAIAAGTSCTVKPAPQTPLTALYLGALAIECGYPYISIVPCPPNTAQQLVQSGMFPKISFTGSSTVGWHLQQLAPQASWSLELGANSACIVHDVDTGIKAIARRCAESAFQFAGQSCIGLQRLYIQQAHYEPMVSALIDSAKRLRVGDPLRNATDIGPLISLEAVQRVRSHLREAIEQKANLLFGGSTYNALTYNPTILDRVHNDMAIVQDELFGPILTVQPYDTLEEAIALVNQSRYGLHAGIYVESHALLNLAFEHLQVGGVVHNDTPTTRLDMLPYGGTKASGFGREGVLSGLDEMTYTKTLIAKQ